MSSEKVNKTDFKYTLNYTMKALKEVFDKDAIKGYCDSIYRNSANLFTEVHAYVRAQGVIPK